VLKCRFLVTDEPPTKETAPHDEKQKAHGQQTLEDAHVVQPDRA